MAFDALYERRKEIEDAVGEGLSWERLDETGRRASRVASYREGNAYDKPETIPILMEWGVEAMARLVKAVKPILADLRAHLAASKS